MHLSSISFLRPIKLHILLQVENFQYNWLVPKKSTKDRTIHSDITFYYLFVVVAATFVM